MTQAFVLTTAAIGKVKQVVKEIKALKGVKSVHVVTGPYDIIVFVEAPNLETLTNMVVNGIHKVKGIVDTNMAIVVEV